MTSRLRPADLPEFRKPPLTEVVLGLQFDAIPGFLSPHSGLIWNRFRDRFPILEEHAPIAPVFETFGSSPLLAPTLNFQFGAGADPTRAFFVNSARTELLQIQSDRFLHNWRKVGDGDQYPRFERMLVTFQAGLNDFAKALKDEGIGTIVPNQCEVTYINQIPIPAGSSLSEVTDDLFGQHTGSLAFDELGKPEDLRFALRYLIRNASGQPVGRLTALAEPALRADGQTIVQLTLTARGRPTTADEQGVTDFLSRGRNSVVRAFAHLTGPKMHKIWERTA